MGDPVAPQKSSQSRREEPRQPSAYENRVKALRTPEVRKRISDGVKRARAKETPAQRKEINRKIAIAYRHTVGAQKLQGETSYATRRDIKKWMNAAGPLPR